MGITAIIISIIAAWIILSTLLVAIICINSSRLSRVDDDVALHALLINLFRRSDGDWYAGQGEEEPHPTNAG